MGKPIAEHQAIQLKLGEMVTRARAARLLTLDASEAYDAANVVDKEAGMAKYFASEAAKSKTARRRCAFTAVIPIRRNMTSNAITATAC